MARIQGTEATWRGELARLSALVPATMTFPEAAERYAAQYAGPDEDDAAEPDLDALPSDGADLPAGAALPVELAALLGDDAVGLGTADPGTTDPRTTEHDTTEHDTTELDAVLRGLEDVQAELGRLEAVRAVLTERLRRRALANDGLLIDPVDPIARSAGMSRRRELAQRAIVADVATALHLGESAAGTLFDHAEALVSRCPRVLTALWHGRTSWRHASILARTAAGLEPPEAGRVDTAVVGAACSSTPAQFTRDVLRARDQVHPVPLDVRHADARTRRGVWVDPAPDGMAWLTAHLPAVFAHAVDDRLTATATQVRADGDARRLGELRADVLTDLLLDDGTLDLSAAATASSSGFSADSSSGSSPGSSAGWPGPDGNPSTDPEPRRASTASLAPLARSIRPRVNVTVPVLTLLGSSDAPATLDGSVPIDAETARALCSHAPSFRRILTHPESGVPLSVGRSTYAVPADLRALLAERDGTCRFPGCARPAHRADLDHTVAWAGGGVTAAANLAHLCRRHHVLKHQTGWAVSAVRDDTPDDRPDDTGMTSFRGRAPLGSTASFGGTLTWTSPTGRRHVTRPRTPTTTVHRTVPRPFMPPDLDETPSPWPDLDPPF